MKKIVSLLLAMIMIFALAACGQSAAPAPAATEAPAAVEEPAAESAPVEEAAPAEEPAPEADALVVDTCILMEADDAMINNYSLLAVNPDAPFVDADGNAVADVELCFPRKARTWLPTTDLKSTANTCSISRTAAPSPPPRFPRPPRRPSTSAFPPPPPSTTPVCWATCCPFSRRSTATRWRSTPPAPASPSPTPRWATPT